ncbi:MAG TPA: hypothetical protein VJ964_05940 [Balneolaceae bacterium]|nr:hypothetical protein [Balneolaceae bacterium]
MKKFKRFFPNGRLVKNELTVNSLYRWINYAQWWRVLLFGCVLITAGLTGVQQGSAQPANALITDYYKATVTQPPDSLNLDPFYKKYTNAEGIPITASGDVPDTGLLVARDIVLYMLSNRPDLRKEMARVGFRVGVMADTDSTMDLPEQRNWKKPLRDDPRLTDYERAHYDRIANMTAAQYWNKRARGMGGRYTTCAEENILGYPGTKYFGENILVHEFSHGIHRAIRSVDKPLAKAIEKAYRQAMKRGLWKNSYAANTVEEYWAEGTQFWFNSNMEYKRGDVDILSSQDLKAYDPALYKLLAEVYPSTHHIPMDVFYKSKARLRSR